MIGYFRPYNRNGLASVRIIILRKYTQKDILFPYHPVNEEETEELITRCVGEETRYGVVKY